MLPAERGEVGQQRVRDQVAAAPGGIQGAAEIDGVPQRDGGRDQGEAAGPVLLRLGGPVAQAPEPVEADGAGKRVAGLALVQRHGGLPSQGGLLGDIILAYETCAREAADKGVPVADHASHLLVHGTLHLFGHDHADDDEAETMEDIDRSALHHIGVADPYRET